MRYLKTEGDIAKAITRQETRGKKMETEHHRIALSILLMWQNTGDCRPAVRLMNDLQNSIPRIADDFSKWVAHLGCFTWNKEEKTWVMNHGYTKVDELLINKAQKPWYEFKKPGEVKPYDDMTSFYQWLDTATKKQKDPKDNYTLHPEFVARMRKTAAEFKLEQEKAA